jgi:hypothetical protein
MKITISKKFSRKEREIICAVWKLARHDHKIENLRSLKFSPLGKIEQALFGGYAYVQNRKGTVKLARDQSTMHFIETVAHELTHIGQYASGDLEDSQHFTFWRNGVILPHALLAMPVFGDIKYNPFYWFAPWEREARKYAAKILKEIQL